MTIEERARRFARTEDPFGDKTDLIKGYIAGATEQKQIDEETICRDWAIKCAQLMRQRDLLLGDVCKWIEENAVEYCDEDTLAFKAFDCIQDLRKAMQAD